MLSASDDGTGGDHFYHQLADEKDIAKDFIRLCLASVANYAIFPLQDVIGCGSEGRMNTPGVASGNWSFRYLASDLNDELAEELKTLTILFGRHTAPSDVEEADDETIETVDTPVDELKEVTADA